MRTIFELRQFDCRWPLGETHAVAEFYCGDPVVLGKAYCPDHCRVAFNGLHYKPTGRPSVNLQTGAGRIATLPRQEAAE